MRTKYLMQLAALLGGLTLAAQGQTVPVYNSGSTGADGAFNPVITDTNLTGVPPGSTWITDSGVTNITVPLNASGIYNFTTITVPANYRMRFLPNANNTPVVWLATGDITIGGEISVGAPDTQAAVAGTTVSFPGPGGYAGGMNGPGSGPYPGIWDGINVWSCDDGMSGGGTAPLSLPLVGGSGGGLRTVLGGGGGGAIYLATSTRMVFTASVGTTPNGIVVSGAVNSWPCPPWNKGGDGAAALFANQIVGTVRSAQLNRILVVAYVYDSAPVGQRVSPLNLSGVSLAASPSAFIYSIGGVLVPQNPGNTVCGLPMAGTTTVQIVTTNLPLGITFSLGVSLLNINGSFVSRSTTTSSPTVAWTNASSGIATGDVVFSSGKSLLTAVATAPVLIAHAPMFDGSPMSEMQLAVDIQGRVTRQFVTRKGAVLSYEAGLTLAMQQGKWQFLLHPLASRT